MQAHTYPSLATLESNDDDQLTAELRLSRLRAQLAVVRAVADEIDRLSRPSDGDGLGEQLIDEMTRLGRELFDSAAALTRSPFPEDSGVFAAERFERMASPRRSR